MSSDMSHGWACTVDPRELPDSGTNNAGVPWSKIRETFRQFCGFQEDQLDEEIGFVNMSPGELEDWSDDDCADQKSVDPQRVRDRVREAMTTHPRDWGTEGVDPMEVDDPEKMGAYDIARKVNSYNARGGGSWEAYGPYKDFEIDSEDVECPSGWGIANLNWAQDPERTYVGDYYDEDSDAREEYTDLREDLQ